MFGWGMKTPFFNTGAYYWPIRALDLTNSNYHVVEVGILSSDHDRACETFYQLMGGQVDYGKEHSEEKGHSQFGNVYEALYPQWSEDHPIHLIGHSYGGTTAIELYQLLCVDFFRVGSNYKWVKSIITIASPLSGATLSPMLGATLTSPASFGAGTYILGCIALTLQKLQEQFPFLHGLYDTRMSQWSESIKWQTIYNSNAKPLNSDDMVFTNGHPEHRLERNKHLIHMDKIHLFTIVTQVKPSFSIPIFEMLIISLMYILWKLKKSKLWVGLLGLAMWRRWQNRDWATGSMILGIFLSLHAKRSAFLFAGMHKDHWEWTDGVVNSYSMIRPRWPDETASTEVRKVPSHISIDMAHDEPFEIAKGQWHVYRVNKNHLCGTEFDRDAAELYLRLFRMLNEISRD
ncbi:hypothetical protein Ae201684P_003423 [Aphanomyces euteiches]|uniref:Lipase-like C-terminal domain-containing protein n=1 Tax=Aphanomyces euteiches TaxID=100861 RepID=A0A6G0WNZ6_9STRA|nr:hypothetical protein Ae201684_013233 [Aphanomyces euteiches]KAH9064631.1 hypothetical protein Ae201684P_003423 [Aphanomyces euteiches]KAH9142262.1 hypothetical protein AeRB84_013655 [Aphanomyces euteiches]